MNPGWWRLLPALALAGCATIVPAELASRVDRSVSGADLIRAPEQYRGQTVVIGGEILHVQNMAGESEIEILERPLEYEEPLLTDHSAGRFLVRHKGFLDPAVYAVGRRVTVVGTVQGDVQRKIGDVDYRYPVLESHRLEIWPLETAASRYSRYPPYWYDPFWDPFWYGDPFWYRGPFWYRSRFWHRDPFWDPFWFRAHRFRR